MYASYPAIYRDKNGQKVTSVQLANNGQRLTMIVRGIQFSGDSFSHLSSSQDTADANLRAFTINQETNWLQAFNIACDIPILVVERGEVVEGMLKVNCVVGAPEDNYKDDYLQLTLMFGESAFQSQGSELGFEDEMGDLQGKLPKGDYIKSCSNCIFSAYDPYCNSGLMGELACFVNSTDKYTTVRGKGYPGWGYSSNKREYVPVQEFYLCQHFNAGRLENLEE